MTKQQSRGLAAPKRLEAEMVQRMVRLDEDLEIMDRHAAEVADVEEQEVGFMRRWDREYKNARLHTAARYLKHVW